MAVTIFGQIKDELDSILTTHLLDPEIVQEIRGYRSYSLDETPLLIISTSGYGYRESDTGELVDITIVTVVKFTGVTEEEGAEQALDDIEQILNDLFNPDDGTYQVHAPYWGAVDFYQPSIRPPSPFGPGTRYAEKYMRFIAYGF